MIQLISKNKYKITIDCGYINGKRKRTSKTIEGSKKDAQIIEGKMLEEIRNNYSYNDKKDLLFDDCINKFLKEYCETNLKLKTIQGYTSLLKDIRLFLGKYKITEINSYILQQFYNWLKETKPNISNNTIIHYYALINDILKQCMYWDLIDTNPNEKIKKPQKEIVNKNIYDQEDITKLKKVLNEYPLEYSVPIMLALDSGMRLEELNGLQWNDINFEDKSIHIQRVRQYIPGKIVTETPKTVKSNRIIYISDYSKDLLVKLRNKEEMTYKYNNIKFNQNNFVFINDNCEPLFTDTISKRFKKILKENNLKIIKFKELRHTCASIMIRAGFETPAVSSRLGHSNTSTTLNIYSQEFGNTKYEIANKMNEILQNCN